MTASSPSGFWIIRDPSGCAAGATPVHNAATAEAAWAFLVPNQQARRKLRKSGWRMELRDARQLEAAALCLLGQCSHEGVRADA